MANINNVSASCFLVKIFTFIQSNVPNRKWYFNAPVVIDGSDAQLIKICKVLLLSLQKCWCGNFWCRFICYHCKISYLWEICQVVLRMSKASLQQSSYLKFILKYLHMIEKFCSRMLSLYLFRHSVVAN